MGGIRGVVASGRIGILLTEKGVAEGGLWEIYGKREMGE